MANGDEHKGQGAGYDVTRDIAAVVREYSAHADYMARVSASADARFTAVDAALRAAFAAVLRTEELEIIDFQSLGVMELARALEDYPEILKPLLAVCNVAGRAIERDLDLRGVKTYGLHLTSERAHAIAGYIKGFLPDSLPLTTLVQIDRNAFIDKEVRANKGRWEKQVNQALNRFSGLTFVKVKSRAGVDDYELDSACVEAGKVRYAVDVKRIEARQDIHKRTDEIVNKAAKLQCIQPDAKFGAVIYYPFTVEQGNIRDRLSSPSIDSVQFAGETQHSVNQAVRLLLSKFGVTTTEDDA